MQEMSTLVVRRATSFVDAARSYVVVLDGNPVGRLRPSASQSLSIAPGQHVLEVQVDWCGSQSQVFEAAPGSTAVFDCGSSLTGWRFILGFYYTFLRTKDYLWLRPSTRSSSV